MSATDVSVYRAAGLVAERRLFLDLVFGEGMKWLGSIFTDYAIRIFCLGSTSALSR